MTDQNTALTPNGDHPLIRDFLQLVKRTDKEDPDPADVRALRQTLSQHPELWCLAGDLARAAALNIVNKLEASHPISQSLKQGWGAMKDELGYQTASPLERLLIEQIVLCWFHLNIVEIEYTNVMAQPIPVSSAEHWERRLSAAQRRYIRACDALARIRKLARTTPALQVNIAAHGGQQLNLLGDQPAND